MILLRAVTPTLVLLLASWSVLAGKPFSNNDLNGDYLYSLTQIRTEFVAGSPVTNYCDNAGTISFDGVGIATVTGSQRCSVTGSAPDAGTFNYSVNPDGSFLLDELAGFPDPVHGQIVNRGNNLLIDGTTRTNPNVMVFHGVAARR